MIRMCPDPMRPNRTAWTTVVNPADEQRREGRPSQVPVRGIHRPPITTIRTPITIGASVTTAACTPSPTVTGAGGFSSGSYRTFWLTSAAATNHPWTTLEPVHPAQPYAPNGPRQFHRPFTASARYCMSNNGTMLPSLEHYSSRKSVSSISGVSPRASVVLPISSMTARNDLPGAIVRSCRRRLSRSCSFFCSSADASLNALATASSTRIVMFAVPKTLPSHPMAHKAIISIRSTQRYAIPAASDFQRVNPIARRPPRPHHRPPRQPVGHIATHVENPTLDEVAERLANVGLLH